VKAPLAYLLVYGIGPSFLLKKKVAKALEQGYSAGQPYHGYYFKVLKGQGPAAPMGEMDFVVNGAMIGGCPLAAAPVQYRVTGVKTFVVGPSGVVYEKDLGSRITLSNARARTKTRVDANGLT